MLRPADALPRATAQQPSKIIFYDGVCPMCNTWVKRIIRWDRKKVFHFAALESETAQKLLTPLLPGYLAEDTFIFLDEDQIYLKSTAALRILKYLGFPLYLGLVFIFIPGFIRDGVYDWIAARRYKYGKRYDSCPIPPVEWGDRFLG